MICLRRYTRFFISFFIRDDHVIILLCIYENSYKEKLRAQHLVIYFITQ